MMVIYDEDERSPVGLPRWRVSLEHVVQLIILPLPALGSHIGTVLSVRISQPGVDKWVWSIIMHQLDSLLV